MKLPVTNNLEFWLEHSLAADSSKLPLADYARQHQLDANAFYRWRTTLRKKGKLNCADSKPSPFVSVSSAPAKIQAVISPATIMVTLPNGLRVEISTVDEDVAKIIQGLMKL